MELKWSYFLLFLVWACVDGFEEGTVEFCMFEYSYTYSKCAHLCHDDMDPVCVADSLCVCDQNVPSTSNFSTVTSWERSLNEETKCTKTDYCDIACREKALHGQYFQQGHLCERDSKSTCICFL